ncbi:DUF6596 domain-containing protein [Streptomyces sp. NPDC048720]|uniref:DUF6596 domain-containing protein n=1 Tax=Streptomyces sp. NPDC048720 TaxID=3365588 RepID=UPI00371FB5CE
MRQGRLDRLHRAQDDHPRPVVVVAHPATQARRSHSPCGQRRPARTSPSSEVVPLAEQDRVRWDRRAIDEGGYALITQP